MPTMSQTSARVRVVGATRGDLRSPEFAYVALKQRILDSDYPPSAQILEQEIAEELGLSRTPVREALVRLQQEGLLEIVPRHGARISALSPSDMREIYEVLESLEAKAADLVARSRPGKQALLPLRRSCDEMEAALSGKVPDLKAWAKADEAFHLSLVRLSGNGRLASMVMTVWDQAHRARMFTLSLRELPVRSTREHREILGAIAAGDAKRAYQLYRDHRQRGGAELMRIIERHGFQRL